MIEAAVARWALRHWKGLTAGVVALVLLVPLLLVGGGIAGSVAAAAADDDQPDLTCVTGTGSVAQVTAADLTEEQRQVTGGIIAAGRDLGVPDGGIVIALAVAFQEGSWGIPDHGDTWGPDSRGPFQQRAPWGPLADRMDPYRSATLFYAGGKGGQPGLLDIAGWQVMQPSRAGNAVQRSRYPDAYAQHLGRAQAVLAAAGPATTPAGATPPPAAPDAACTPVTPSQRGADGRWPAESNAGQPHNLTPRTLRVRQLIEQTFGETNIGGYVVRNIAGTGKRSDHSTGNAVDVMILPWTDPGRIADGNRIAQWASANWDALAIKYVIWRKQITHDGVTWSEYHHPGGGGGVTLDHWNHVHLSIY